MTTGEYPNPIDSVNWVAKIDHQFGGNDHFSVRYSLYDVRSSNARGVGNLNAPSASSALDNLDQTIAAGNVVALSERTVLETRAQFAHSDLAAPPTDPIGPAVSIPGIASFGTSSGSPTGPVEQAVSNREQPVASGGRARRARRRRRRLQRSLHYVSSRRCAGPTRSRPWPTFLAGVYGNAGFAQTFGETTSAQTNPNVGLYVQDEWRVQPGLTLNAGLRYDLQWLETISTDSNNVSPRAGFVWAPVRRREDDRPRECRAVLRPRAAPGAGQRAALRRETRPTSTAFARSASPCRRLNPARPCFRTSCRQVVPTVTLVNFTTMDRNLENAYSRQASLEVEHQVGRTATVSVGYHYLRGHEADHVGQSERADLRRVGKQQRLPAESQLCEQQPVLRRRTFGVRRTARLVPAAAGGVGQLSGVVHLFEIDEQHGRGLLQLADRSAGHLEGLGPVGRRPAAPARGPCVGRTPRWRRRRRHGNS